MRILSRGQLARRCYINVWMLSETTPVRLFNVKGGLQRFTVICHEWSLTMNANLQNGVGREKPRPPINGELYFANTDALPLSPLLLPGVPSWAMVRYVAASDIKRTFEIQFDQFSLELLAAACFERPTWIISDGLGIAREDLRRLCLED